MKIDDYQFGQIVIEGKTYNADVIVFPDRVRPNWWRKEGHSLAPEDLAEVFDFKPEVIVIGTGFYSVMQVPEPTKQLIKSNSIDLIIQDSRKAYKTLNELFESGKKTVGCFHLTC